MHLAPMPSSTPRRIETPYSQDTGPEVGARRDTRMNVHVHAARDEPRPQQATAGWIRT
jgi:hypothetical protein